MASGKRIEAIGPNQEDEVLSRLVDAGERLGTSDCGAILRRGSEVVPPLLCILEDDELAREDAPGHGYAPVHAAKLLSQLGTADAIAPMLRVLARCDPMDVLYSAVVDALESMGAPVLQPALAAYAVAGSEDHRTAVANVLSGLGVRDDRILPVLLDALKYDVVLGAGLLAEYGDPAALPHLDAALDGCELDPGADCSRTGTSSSSKQRSRSSGAR
jgi:HEAT repeat protein